MRRSAGVTVAMLALRTISTAIGLGALWFALDSYSVFAPEYGVWKAIGTVAGMVVLAAPFVWSGLTGRGEVLEHIETRLRQISSHAEAYHAGAADRQIEKPKEDGSVNYLVESQLHDEPTSDSRTDSQSAARPPSPSNDYP